MNRGAAATRLLVRTRGRPGNANLRLAPQPQSVRHGFAWESRPPVAPRSFASQQRIHLEPAGYRGLAVGGVGFQAEDENTRRTVRREGEFALDLAAGGEVGGG